MIGIVQQNLPILGPDAACKEIGIERGTAHHRQHFAGAGIQSHHRSTPVLEGEFSDRLQIKIYG